MAAAKRVYNDMDEILGVVLESDSSDIDLDDDDGLDSDWEYESGEEEGQFEPPHENLDDPVDPPVGEDAAECARDGSVVTEEERDIETNENNVEEITEEFIIESSSSSEDGEPLVRLRQRAPPNNHGRGRGRGRSDYDVSEGEGDFQLKEPCLSRTGLTSTGTKGRQQKRR